MFADCVGIPSAPKRAAFQHIHSPHSGAGHMKSIVRTTACRPGVAKNIKTYNFGEPVKGLSSLVVVASHSKWPSVVPLKSVAFAIYFQPMDYQRPL